VRAAGPARTAVVFDASDPAPRWSVYCALRVEFGPDLRVYAPAPDPSAGVVPMPHGLQPVDPATLDADTVIVVRPQRLDAAGVAREVQGRPAILADGPVASALLASGRWTRDAELHAPAYVSADLDVLRRRTDP
jgi:hypothetical protein